MTLPTEKFSRVPFCHYDL